MTFLNIPCMVVMGLMFISTLKFLSLQQEALSSLIILELMALSVYFFMLVISSSNPSDMFTVLIFMTLAVCDGTLGISLMLLMARTSGNQVLSSQKFLKW